MPASQPIKTTFANGINPFRLHPSFGKQPPKASPMQAPKPVITPIKPKRVKARDTFVDPDELEICNDPLPGRITNGNKYDKKFSALRYGQALKVPDGKADRVAQSLRDWLKSKKMTGVVKAVKVYVDKSGNSDGSGRVWLLQK